MPNIAILASHNGSGFDAIYQAIKSKTLNANIALLISNNENSKALKNAQSYDINHFLVNATTHPTPDEEIYKLLKEYQCHYVFLSGYMKKLSPLLTANFHIINAHPSLLPKYGGAGMYGRFVHEAVINSKDKISGVTIHDVNAVYDDGKTLLQREMIVEEGETAKSLETKIKELEKTAIVEALKQCLK
ncbi:MAG: phosphoribosylglycinamide formyltransferase [Sulfurimonas sp.]